RVLYRVSTFGHRISNLDGRSGFASTESAGGGVMELAVNTSASAWRMCSAFVKSAGAGSAGGTILCSSVVCKFPEERLTSHKPPDERQAMNSRFCHRSGNTEYHHPSPSRSGR